MAYVTITLQHFRNSSVQVGDGLYFIPVWNSVDITGGFNTGFNEIVYLGPIIDISATVDLQDLPNNTQVNVGEHILTIDVDPQLSTLPSGQVISGLVLPELGDFLMFSKNNKANMSSIAGYYAELNFINTSKHYAELFSIGTEITESSN